MLDKPRFKHTTYFRKSDIEGIGNSIWTPTIKDWRDVIEDYIEISKKRKNNKLAMFKLQIDLLGDIVLINDTIKGYIKLVEDPMERKSRFPNIETNEKNVEYWEREINIYKIILNALKDIGDGIAWRVLNYDRSLIYNMCVNNEDPGPASKNPGLLNELNSIGDFSNDVEVVNFVYHAITNFLLISDLTVLYSNGDINFVEVKSGKNPRGKSWKERLNRQKVRAANIVKIGNESEGESSEVAVRFKLVESKPQTMLDQLDTLLKRVRDKHIITKVINSYLGIAIINFSNLTDKISFQDKFIKLTKQLKKSEHDILIFPHSIENFEFSPNRAPLSIHPFNSEDIANILFGKYIINYFFNVSQFIKEIEKYGWNVFDIIYKRKNNVDPSMFSVKKDKFIMKIPPTLMARAIFEGLTVESIIRIFEDSMKNVPIDNGEFAFYGYEKEKYLWN